MEEQQFWEIIESGGRKTLRKQELQHSAICKQLRKLRPTEVRDFDRWFNLKMIGAYSWDLWSAAYLVNGGCSDDGFVYFCAWLISRGQKVYVAALENPDSLAGVVDPKRDDHEFEELWYAAKEVYEELTEEEMPAPKKQWPKKPKGTRWNFDDDEEVKRRFPALAKIYL